MRIPQPAFRSMLSRASKLPTTSFCPSRAVPAPSSQSHSPGAPPPSPKHPALATHAARVFASERARAQRPGARGRSGTQCAQLGASGGLAAPAGHTLRPGGRGRLLQSQPSPWGAGAGPWPGPPAPPAGLLRLLRGAPRAPRGGWDARSGAAGARVPRKGEGWASEIKGDAGVRSGAGDCGPRWSPAVSA